MNTYGVIPTSLVESAAWRKLTASAKLAYVVCESLRWNNLAGIYPYHPGVVAEHAGFTIEETEMALSELEVNPSPSTSFIVRGDGILWIRHHLRARPNVSAENSKHQTAVRDILVSLPAKSDVVRKFRKYYKSWLDTQPKAKRGPNDTEAFQTSSSSSSSSETETETSSTTRARAKPEAPPAGSRTEEVALATGSDKNPAGPIPTATLAESARSEAGQRENGAPAPRPRSGQIVSAAEALGDYAAYLHREGLAP